MKDTYLYIPACLIDHVGINDPVLLMVGDI